MKRNTAGLKKQYGEKYYIIYLTFKSVDRYLKKVLRCRNRLDRFSVEGFEKFASKLLYSYLVRKIDFRLNLINS